MLSKVPQQWLKNPVLSLQGFGLLLRCGFNPWLRNFYITSGWGQKKKKRIYKSPNQVLLTLQPSHIPSATLLLGFVRISTGDSVAEEDTSSLLFAKTEDTLPPQGSHRQFPALSSAQVLWKRKRDFFFQNMVGPLWSVMCTFLLWIAW